jgi:hypothetical protein
MSNIECQMSNVEVENGEVRNEGFDIQYSSGICVLFRSKNAYPTPNIAQAPATAEKETRFQIIFE